MHVYEHRDMKLHRTGGSQSVLLPASWLKHMAIKEHVKVLRTDVGIVIEAPEREACSIEEEPEFASFLTFLMKDALAHPEKLRDLSTLVADADELFDGVEIDE